MYLIDVESVDPYFNLALEEYIFETLPQNTSCLILWQNDNAVIVGKHQNTIEEVDEKFVQNNGIRVVRRLSGGGAVYHDLGNLNFTLINDAKNIEELNLRAFTSPVIETLKQLGVKAENNGRNDITIEGKKFSGNSQYIKYGRIMHHGTLMFDSDLSILSKVLNVSKVKVESKGFKSVKSRVTNIKDYLRDSIELSDFKERLIYNISGDGSVSEYALNSDSVKNIEEIANARYSSWEWNYGSSPKYSIIKERRIGSVGTVQIQMEVANGMITKFTTYGDYFGKGDTVELVDRIVGTMVNENSLKVALSGIDIESYYHNMAKYDFIDLIVG